MIRFLVSAIFLSLFHNALSQFNDTTDYYLNYTSTGIFNKTNDRNAYVLNNGLKFSIYKKKISFNTNNSWIFGEQNASLTNNDFNSSLDFNVLKEVKPIYYWGLAGYEKSFSLRINYRFQTGVGLGYTIVRNKHSVIIVSNGVLYESELGTNDYQTLRNSFRLKFRFVFKDVIVLDGSDFLQHSLDDRKDYIIRSNTTLSVKLIEWLSFTAALSYNKLNRTGRENLLSNIGLTIDKYF
jgi:hypothetical protein